MRPGGCCCDLPDGTRETITAGDVFPLTLRAGRHDPLPRADVAPAQELVFAPLGGVGEIGMNLSIYGLGRRSAGGNGWRSISACRSPRKSICRASI